MGTSKFRHKAWHFYLQWKLGARVEDKGSLCLLFVRWPWMTCNLILERRASQGIPGWPFLFRKMQHVVCMCLEFRLFPSWISKDLGPQSAPCLPPEGSSVPGASFPGTHHQLLQGYSWGKGHWSWKRDVWNSHHVFTSNWIWSLNSIVNIPPESSVC